MTTGRKIYEVNYGLRTYKVKATEEIHAKLNLCFSLGQKPNPILLREMIVREHKPKNDIIDVEHNFKYVKSRDEWVVE